jgi:predicted RNA methylase
MNITIDPERNEIDALLDFAGDLQGRRLLEIGAGKGRLTWRYASKARAVLAIDPNPERITHAQNDMPKELRGHVVMLNTALEEYQHDVQTPLFDVALLSWAL